MKLRRKRLRRNLRVLHPIPYLQRKEQEEWNRICDEAMRRSMLAMTRNYGPPRIPMKWGKYLLAAAVGVAIVAGYLAGSHKPSTPQYSSQQTRF